MKCLNKEKDLTHSRSNLSRLKVTFCSVLLAYLTTMSSVNAAPAGGNIVGGAGAINTSGLTTNIQQNTSSLAINWQSYNLNSNEIVNYIQPSRSSIALNRILGGSASQIHGKINANGQVVLVNPNGIFFGKNASVNVGGLIASGLDIDPVDFMNGDYVFSEVLGTDGSVINSGLINASLGGNVTLLGKQVTNEGVISARLGAVNMAAGKEAVLTFDHAGLIGVKISREILQDELGINPAVLNSGEINAEGGRVLLSASVSRDIFSEAVNHDGIEQATSVVVHEDGSFTLGGSDVINTGDINVSSNEDGNAGQVVMLGDNVTHSGTITADAETGQAGQIELHSTDTTELIDDALISAQATQSGVGGSIKVLGNKIGLFNNAEVNANGISGGGEILVGGDRQGLNPHIRNAEFIYLGENSNVYADAIDNGNGGRIITYANDTGRFYGGIYARGGHHGGNGGFIETSGKKGFVLPVAPDVSAVAGEGGLWLIDPYDITIQAGGDPTTYNETTSLPDTFYTSTDPNPAANSTIDAGVIQTALVAGNVEIITDANDGGGQGGDIIFDAILDYGAATNTLTLNSDGGISFSGAALIEDTSGAGGSLNLNLYANDTISLNATITTQGGNLTVGGSGGNTPTSFTNNGTIDTTGRANTAGGNISIETTNTITTNILTTNGGIASNNSNGQSGGSITLLATNAIQVDGDLLSVGSNGNDSGGGGSNEQYTGGTGGTINVTSTNSTINISGSINNSGGNADGDIATAGGNAGNIILDSQSGAGSVTLAGGITTSGGSKSNRGSGLEL